MKKKLYISKILSGKVFQEHFVLGHPGSSELLNSVAFDLIPGALESSYRKTEGPQCPHCKMSKADLDKLGRVGCPSCYETFGRALKPLLKKIHRGIRHLGKVPAKHLKSEVLEERLFLLQNRLQKSISEEDYEEAACLRDNIEILKSMQSEDDSEDQLKS